MLENGYAQDCGGYAQDCRGYAQDCGGNVFFKVHFSEVFFIQSVFF